MIFAFEFQLSVDKLTTPAAEAEKSIGKVTAALAALRKATDSIDGLLGRVGSRLGRGIDGERAARSVRTNMAKIADEWQRMAAKAEAAEARATRAAEREAQRRLAIKEREGKAQERMLTRIAFAAQRAQDRALEQASRKSYFGGHKSIMGLLSSRAEAKVSGMATSAADSVLGMPGALLGGIGGLALSGVTAAAGAAVDLAKWSGEAAFNFGKMAVSSQAMRENSVKGFESMYGNTELANRLVDQSIRIAKLTKFDTPEVIETFNNLAFGGKFKADVLPMLFSAGADVGSARGNRKGQLFLKAMAELNSQPEAFWGGFSRAANAGPGQESAIEALLKRTNINTKGTTNRRAVMKAMLAGQISKTDAMNALLDAVQSTYDKGEGGALMPLGTMAKNQGSGTWEGLLSNIRNGLQDVLAMRLPVDHPMMKFKGLLVEVNSLFDEQTDRGRRFQAMMARLVEDVFLVFDIDPQNTGKIGKAMDNLLGMAEALEVKVRSVAEWLRDNVSRPLAEGLSGDWGASLAGKLRSGFIDLGMTLGKAVAAGMFDAMGLSGRAAAIVAKLKGPTDTPAAKTPEQTQREQYDMQRANMGAPRTDSSQEWDTGGWQIKGPGAERTADAMGLPKMARGGDVYEPTIALIAERGPERVGPIGGSGPSIVLQGGLHFHLPQGLSGHTQQDAAMLGQALMSWVAQQSRSPSAATQPGA